MHSTFAVRETASLGIMGAPRVPPLCRETQSLGQQMLNAPVGINGLKRIMGESFNCRAAAAGNVYRSCWIFLWVVIASIKKNIFLMVIITSIRNQNICIGDFNVNKKTKYSYLWWTCLWKLRDIFIGNHIVYKKAKYLYVWWKRLYRVSRHMFLRLIYL